MDQLMNVDIPAQIQTINNTLKSHFNIAKKYGLLLLCY
jgi:hypothetical protein